MFDGSVYQRCNVRTKPAVRSQGQAAERTAILGARWAGREEGSLFMDSPSDSPRHVVIVWTGNICRSPMASGILQQRLAQDGLANSIMVASAGTRGVDGSFASPHAVQAMAARGVDVSNHRVRTLRPIEERRLDLILGLEDFHVRAVLRARAAAKDRVLLFSEIAGENAAVEDAYGLPIGAYRECAEESHRLLTNGYADILRRLGRLAS